MPGVLSGPPLPCGCVLVVVPRVDGTSFTTILWSCGELVYQCCSQSKAGSKSCIGGLGPPRVTAVLRWRWGTDLLQWGLLEWRDVRRLYRPPSRLEGGVEKVRTCQPVQWLGADTPAAAQLSGSLGLHPLVVVVRASPFHPLFPFPARPPLAALIGALSRAVNWASEPSETRCRELDGFLVA